MATRNTPAAMKAVKRYDGAHRRPLRFGSVSTTPTLSDLWRRGQHGWPESYPIAQFPNAPLLLAMGGWLVAALTHGSAHAYARATFYTGLAAWAWGDLTKARCSAPGSTTSSR